MSKILNLEFIKTYFKLLPEKFNKQQENHKRVCHDSTCMFAGFPIKITIHPIQGFNRSSSRI